MHTDDMATQQMERKHRVWLNGEATLMGNLKVDFISRGPIRARNRSSIVTTMLLTDAEIALAEGWLSEGSPVYV